MDEFAGLIPYLPKRIAIRIWGVPFAEAWLILAPVVDKERAKCAWSDKWHAFERSGRSALASHPEVQAKRLAANKPPQPTNGVGATS
jgi:hypothetical protein